VHKPKYYFVNYRADIEPDMNIPRDHHFIPAFYLKQWTDQNGKLVEYTR
jgi:hypothetical protein